MKYLSNFKLFENKIDMDPKNYVDDYLSVHELHTEFKAVNSISKLIKKIEDINYPFEAYLLDDNVWTTDISNINNYHPGDSYIKKVIVNEGDLDIDQTIRGRILEFDCPFLDSHYVSFNNDLIKEDIKLNILSEIYDFSICLKDDDIKVGIALFFSNGEKKNMNILTIELNSKDKFLPIDDTINFLFRLDNFIKEEWGFTENRPNYLHGKLNANIYFQTITNVGFDSAQFLTLDELDRKSSSFTVNLPFKKLIVTYYKYLQ
jgi:hypothetical protein